MHNAVLPSTPPGRRGGRLCNCHMITPTPSAIVSTSGKYKIHSTVADLGFLVCAKLVWAEIFAENCIKIKEIGLKGVSLTLPGSANV